MLDHVYTSSNFEAWYKSAKPGDQYTYYIGHIGMGNKDNVPHVKHTAWKYAVKGRVYLFRKKIADEEYDYIAYKSRWYVPRLVPLDYYKNKLSPVED